MGELLLPQVNAGGIRFWPLRTCSPGRYLMQTSYFTSIISVTTDQRNSPRGQLSSSANKSYITKVNVIKIRNKRGECRLVGGQVG